MRRAFLIVLVLGVIVALVIREVRLHEKPALEAAYVGAQGVTVWNSTAQIRTKVASLTYGEPVEVFQRDGDNALIATKAGVRGWVSSASLESRALWHAAALLNEMTKPLAAQARGSTRVRTNIHIRPGRQWEVISTAPGGTDVEIFERKAVANAEQEAQANGNPGAPLEDWWLVRAEVKNVGEISGWVLGRFVSLDLPEPLPEYQSSERIAIVAWFEINHAADSMGAAKPEYLVMGTRDGEGRPCDFTLLRVYTWSGVRHRYETAFMDRGLCGSLPVETVPAATPGGKAFFSFCNIGLKGKENRRYEMNLTVVRRIDKGASSSRREKKR